LTDAAPARKMPGGMEWRDADHREIGASFRPACPSLEEGASAMPQRLVSACVVALLVVAGLTPAGRGEEKKEEKKKAKDLILAKWEMSKSEGKGDLKVDVKVVMEFVKDGKVKASVTVKVGDNAANTVDAEGKYKWVDDDTLEVTFTDPQSKKEETKKLKAKVSEKELELTDPTEKDKDKATAKFTKVK
jgi:uncharacterized protein (TIGR03066 family)